MKRLPHEMLLSEIRYQVEVMEHVMADAPKERRSELIGRLQVLMRFIAEMSIPPDQVEEFRNSLQKIREKSSSPTVKGLLTNELIEDISD